MIRARVGCMLHEDICKCGRRCIYSRTYHIPRWSRFGAPYHALHFVKPNIECLQLDMSRVRIENRLFVERVNDREGLRKTEGRRGLAGSEDGWAVDDTQPTASVMAGLAGLRHSFLNILPAEIR